MKKAVKKVTNIEQDKKTIEEFVKDGKLLWGTVVRVGKDAEKGEYMIVLIHNRALTDNYPCIVYRPEADAEFKSGHLAYLTGYRVPVIAIGTEERNGDFRMVGSRKNAQMQQKANMLQDLASSKVMNGTILNFVSYGAYVEVNGVVGMLKNTDYSIDFSEIIETHKPGDKITVKCKEVTTEGKIFWTVPEKTRRAEPIKYDIEVGNAFIGTVQSVKMFPNGVGVFVRIATGLDALCSLPQNVEVEVGVKVSMQVTSVEPPKEEYLAPRVKGRIIRTV